MADPWLERCTAFYLRRAARQVTRIYDTHLAASGLSLTQYSVLARLAPCESPCQHDFAAIMGMDRTTLTRTLKPLTKQGLVELAPGIDGRTVAIRLTPEGRARMALAKPLWQAAQEEIRRRLGDSEVVELNHKLDDHFKKLDA